MNASLRKELVNLIEGLEYTTKIETIDGIDCLKKVKRKDDKVYGEYDEINSIITISNQVKRTDLFPNSNNLIENLTEGDELIFTREKNNQFDSNAIIIKNKEGEPIGYLDYSTARILSPLIDDNELEIIETIVSNVLPLSKRSKSCKYGLVYYNVKLKVLNEYIKNTFILNNKSKEEDNSKYDRNKCIQKIKEYFMITDINQVTYAVTTDDCYLLFLIGNKVEDPKIPYWEENMLIGHHLLNDEFEKAIKEATNKNISVFDYDFIYDNEDIDLDEW